MVNNFKELKIKNLKPSLGFIYETPDYAVVFGNKHLNSEQLKKFGQEKNFQPNTINQKHTVEILPYPITDQVCDGVFTNVPYQAMTIRTADCLPLLATNEDRIFALHCGRKGLVDGILKNLKIQYDDYKPLWQFFIGPHILAKSYEIGPELFNQIRVLHPKTQALINENDRFYFSLKTFTLEQLKSEFPNAKVFELDIDTFSDENYYSYRRDNKTLERNFSFIWKKA